MMARLAVAAISLTTTTGCTLAHSKQALFANAGPPPSAAATFVTEEDSGLSLLGLIAVTEPDHYAVLLERAQRRFHCERLVYPQLDFYTDHWLIVAFPIARITLLCEPARGAEPAVIPAP